MQQLKDRGTEDIDDFRIEPGDRPLAEGRDDVVEGALPAQRAGRDLAGERTVALVRQCSADSGERVRKIRGF
jgi:hypothetical protein